MYQPAPAAPGLLGGGADGAGLGIARAPSALGGVPPGGPGAPPQQSPDLFGGPLAPPTASPGGSLSATPRPSLGLGPADQPPSLLSGLMPPGAGAAGAAPAAGLQPAGSGSTWSSLDGIQRAAFPGGGGPSPTSGV